jgi:hypothetical protein
MAWTLISSSGSLFRSKDPHGDSFSPNRVSIKGVPRDPFKW